MGRLEPKQLFGIALSVILIGQLYFLPTRIDQWTRAVQWARLSDPADKARRAYGVADYDLLVWVEGQTPREATLLLLTPGAQANGNPAYVMYHRALYHLYPRTIWWAAPEPPTTYPVWWIPTDVNPAAILAVAEQHQATIILADGFSVLPLAGSVRSFDADTHLIFLEDIE